MPRVPGVARPWREFYDQVLKAMRSLGHREYVIHEVRQSEAYVQYLWSDHLWLECSRPDSRAKIEQLHELGWEDPPPNAYPNMRAYWFPITPGNALPESDYEEAAKLVVATLFTLGCKNPYSLDSERGRFADDGL